MPPLPDFFQRPDAHPHHGIIAPQGFPLFCVEAGITAGKVSGEEYFAEDLLQPKKRGVK